MAEPEPFVRHALEVTRRRAFFSFPAAAGLPAAVRRFRYRWRTSLYMYRRDRVEALMEKTAPGRYTIERLARDFFVRVDI